MIWLGLAWAAPLGTVDAQPVSAENTADVLTLSHGDLATQIAIEKGCTWRAALQGRLVHVETVCGATVKQAGILTRYHWPLTGQPARTGTAPLLEQLEADLTAAAKQGDLHRARALFAQWGGRLHYAGTPELRARLLGTYVEAVTRRAEEDAAFGLHERAAGRLIALLAGPPVWESERPWDYMKRIRIGAAPGNRPAPERTAYLDNTAAHRALVTRMVAVLNAGGHLAVAQDLAKEANRPE